jgi:signal transduction histidine kinase
MQIIMSMTEFLSQPSSATAHVEYVASITDAIHIMRRLANDVLDLSKMEAGGFLLEHVAFNLRDCVRSVTRGYEVLSKGKNISFVVQIADDLPTEVVSDPVRLQQILTNLLSNAFKVRLILECRPSSLFGLVFAVQFTMQGVVSLSISARKEDPERELPAARLMALVQVRDTGEGRKGFSCQYDSC